MWEPRKGEKPNPKKNKPKQNQSKNTNKKGEHAPFTRVFIIGQTKQWVNNTNNAPSTSNKRGADQQERIKLK